MYVLVLVTATLFLRDVRSVQIMDKMKDYYNNADLTLFKKAWIVHRAPMEHAIKSAIAETAGLPGMNVYVRKHPEKLALGYLHDDYHVKVILSDLYLKGMPRCRMPDVQFPLHSNVIKIETQLSKIIMHANYSVVRNKQYIIDEAQDQDPLKYSPFLFDQVNDNGRIAIRADGCILSGFIIATLGAESVNLGYDYFNLTNCEHTIEIYNPEQASVPVIAKYNLNKDDGSELGLTQLMLRPLLTEELLPKIQGAIFSFINTTAIFDNKKLAQHKEKQRAVFKETETYMIDLVRNLNKKKSHEEIAMRNLDLKWNSENVISLRDMKLYGMDTMYQAHSGGPVPMGDDLMIAEELRFSSLQVRGTLHATSNEEAESYDFAADITDLVVDFHLDEKNWDKGFKLLAVKGLRHMIVVVSALTNGTEESLIAGHLLNDVPKEIHNHLIKIIPEAVNPHKL